MGPAGLTPDDVEELAAHGLTEAEALRQLELLRDPPARLRLERAATVGDGIETVPGPRREPLAALAREAAAAGRLRAFVPASGAASRMFQDLSACRNQGGAVTREWLAEAEIGGHEAGRALRRLLEGLPRLAFHDALRAALAAQGHDPDAVVAHGPWRPLLDALLETDGLGYAHLPKGLIPFHRGRDEVRTAFEEHLAEGAALLRDDHGRARLHVTISPEHREEWNEALETARDRFASRAEFEVEFSVQSPATDTLALDPEGRPFRGADGALLFRPAGHGALIGNLGGAGDLVFIKNVDNVAHEDWKEPTVTWTGVLAGRLVEIERAAFAWLDRLAADGGEGAVSEAAGFCERTFFTHPPADLAPAARRAWVRDRLDRPIRVCGMVPNTGEPGGGPFWVRGPEGGASIQIVEGAQVDPESPAQQQLFRRGTHFNPAFLACALRRRDGTPHDLARFVDPRAVIVTEKSAGGRRLLALERPGLWNGAMAGWNTVLVEVPLAVFNPVKTVLDLLRPAHQPRPRD